MSEPKDTLILCTVEPARGGYALWWKPDRAGYCAELDGAGRYGRSEASRICAGLEGRAMPVPLQTAMAYAVTLVGIEHVFPPHPEKGPTR